MNKYVHPTEQLVTEIVVKDIRRSTEFYSRMGFRLLRDGGDFVELTWEDHRLFLAQLSAFPGMSFDWSQRQLPTIPPANVRVMLSNVDDQWKVVGEIGAQIVLPVADRYYGLRDFTIVDPDGFGVRFATDLKS
jgi:catechol 2,3-dioxygenase-like lactoylglutathione lyase family enzyme